VARSAQHEVQVERFIRLLEDIPGSGYGLIEAIFVWGTFLKKIFSGFFSFITYFTVLTHWMTLKLVSH
jgi:hypothetical protein